MAAYKSRTVDLPAFDLEGFTKIVSSGGEQYGEVKHDGRWEILRALSSATDGMIYGVASEDSECPQGKYRYTIAIKNIGQSIDGAALPERLFPIHIPASTWVVFTLNNFAAQYGQFWQDNPYSLIEQMDWQFNWEVGLHIDVYAPSFSRDEDPMEFYMPVCQRTQRG